ncbi:Variant SH3 domain [Geosmithia morbida]|uniref:Variant SH3 domain n=1 Tax=Geosmithia morbida TaxID=1094350 RepID=A0A9P4YUA6_9HYPO|nr:Variant SH3 domain [Geosmithia morbida]KAF4122682.1 Variant SH3 domain [Geosmithia morbida]
MDPHMRNLTVKPQETLQETLQETVSDAVDVITSKRTRRAAVNTAVLLTGGTALVFVAAIASALFFQNFVPDQVLSVPVYLQYGSSPHPYGVASLTAPWIKSAQDYDVSVTLTLPPSRPNEERGNFMVSLHLLDRDVTPRLLEAAQEFSSRRDRHHYHHAAQGGFGDQGGVVFSSRRPALVPYVDPVVSAASRTLFLFYHVLFPGARTHEVTVRLAERVAFGRAHSLPASAFVELEAGQDLQTYDVRLNFTAQLRGLRWLMHHYRLPTYLVFTFFFWACEVVFMGLIWAIWTSWASSGTSAADKGRDYGTPSESDDTAGAEAEAEREEEEEEEVANSSSDDGVVSTTLKRELGTVKKEEDEEAERDTPLSELPLGGAEADDERDAGPDARPQHGERAASSSYREEGGGQVRRRDSGRQGGGGR